MTKEKFYYIILLGIVPNKIKAYILTMCCCMAIYDLSASMKPVISNYCKRRRIIMKQQFYECDHCGNMIAFVKDSGFSVICCDKEMHEVIPGAIDASTEKHIPAYSVKDGIVTVEVGSMLHPMTEEHHIEWIPLQTKYGNQRKELCSEGEPCVTFAVCEGDEVEAVFAYCNLHGLWEAGGQKRRYSYFPGCNA